MNVEQELRNLHQALNAHLDPTKRLRAGRNVLIVWGCEALGIEHSAGLPLHDLIAIAVDAPPTAARRSFSMLLVHALAVEGLVASKSHRSELDRNVCALIESTLPAVLQRFGYPFSSDTYERRRSLDRLHVTIDDLLRPLEPTFPPGIQGLYAG
jgi:hypothetical protein